VQVAVKQLIRVWHVTNSTLDNELAQEVGGSSG
jgi:hypothetical protein